jgi:DNA-binding NarL/FixJ family response regulator
MRTEMNEKKLILIITPPGDLQIGLQALLTTHLDVDVLAVSEVDSAIKVIQRYEPALVILDQNISKKELVSIITEIKGRWPEIICLLLVNDDQSRDHFDQAGADRVIVKGLLGSRLVEEIRLLLKT